ncbi:MAG: FAA hydrolase family protein [Bacteroidia bacterium]|nr:MAG: FAA hydrolase family protein [Bacteroidia bacterium]
MKIICIGRNYAGHIREMNQQPPGYPLFFMKPETAIIRAQLPFYYPDFSKEIHYEAELVLRICKLGKNIQPRFAHTYYDAVTVGIDFTARDLQKQCIRDGLPWEMAKAFDGSAAISKFVHLNDLDNNKSISFLLKKNGKTVQTGNSDQMLHSFDKIIAHVSQYVTLKIGDYIFTGTPEGVGPVQIGDHLELFLEDKLMLKLPIK